MEKQLFTCPACRTDQHIYGGKVCNHTSYGGLRCPGSRSPIKAQRPVEPLSPIALTRSQFFDAWNKIAQEQDTTSALANFDQELLLGFGVLEGIVRGSFGDMITITVFENRTYKVGSAGCATTLEQMECYSRAAALIKVLNLKPFVR